MTVGLVALGKPRNVLRNCDRYVVEKDQFRASPKPMYPSIYAKKCDGISTFDFPLKLQCSLEWIDQLVQAHNLIT